jgi:hypothetical protein
MYLLSAIGLSPGGSSTANNYTKQQYTEQHNNTENTVRDTQNNKNTTHIQHTHDKSYFNVRKINQKRTHNLVSDNTK